MQTLYGPKIGSKRPIFFLILLLILFGKGFSQSNGEVRIFTSDIENYWIAFDSIQSTRDAEKQIQFIRDLYIDKGTQGLKDFMKARNFTANEWLMNIKRYPKFWLSIRPKTLDILKQKSDINDLLRRFKKVYPKFQQPDIYFAIGCLRSGGTTFSNKILIGSEIAAADSSIERSEFSHWLQSVFEVGQGVPYYVAHETLHTQQKGNGSTLLAKCIREGSCDFIAELILQHPLNTPYMFFGKLYEEMIWKRFKTAMYGTEHQEWLANGARSEKGKADLGYFIGYMICKSYYDKSKDKAKALKKIIELNYSNRHEVRRFFNTSGYADKWY